MGHPHFGADKTAEGFECVGHAAIIADGTVGRAVLEGWRLQTTLMERSRAALSPSELNEGTPVNLLASSDGPAGKRHLVFRGRCRWATSPRGTHGGNSSSGESGTPANAFSRGLASGANSDAGISGTTTANFPSSRRRQNIRASITDQFRDGRGF
jgi:hypothetical protein